MVPTLPPLLAAMIAAHNDHNVPAFVDCFTEDAVVRDEGRTYVGLPSIREWFENVSRKYEATVRVTALATKDGEPVLHAKVSGNFDGSPVDMRYFLALEEGKIVALKIAA